MRAEVFKQTEFRCSAGIAHNKVMAKLIAGLHKPNKQTVVFHEVRQELMLSLNSLRQIPR